MYEFYIIGQGIKIDQTEVIENNQNPDFIKTFTINYFFQVQQHLKMEVHNQISSTQTQIIGQAQTTVAEVIGSKNQLIKANLYNQSGRNNGQIFLKADHVKLCREEFSIQLSGLKIRGTKLWFWDKISPFLRFYRLKHDIDFGVLVYETESAKDMASIKWKEIQCQAQKLCNGDYSIQIKVELWDYKKSGKHKYIGETQFCTNELIESNKAKKILQKEFRSMSQRNQSLGILQFDRFSIISNYTFLDYCAGGQQINLMLAIDFTASNEEYHNPNSLHHLPSNGYPSQYLQAINSVVEILIHYDYDKRVPLYGFGCKPKMKNHNTSQTIHLFPLNDNPDDPEVYGLDGIVECYKKSLPQLHFDGPTYLHPTLQKAMEMAKKCKNQGSENYHVLLILTDGQTDDMLDSIDDIIASSYLPLSIIIVGIGNANFKNMKILDNDNKSMVDSKGNKAIRDLVQFVPFNQFKGDPTQLSNKVLEELPTQLLEYMKLVEIRPKPPKVVSPNSFKHSNLENEQIPTRQANQYPLQQYKDESKILDTKQNIYDKQLNNSNI
ncbi:unnamed protein product (macronuclear) [Paramecium tetraurelia]|uniref:Uncharacterized protein n=1 Tax=Paramecium tetraurelia TaxID=5888 RepID=A0EH95_PARTE|nr:uncharacterized protein GSPATT00027010001 [Paramecium tetraurelia]CAK94686.1 unnamed protein product [Paramecium tetraurelia]|eukprot:XP_001462059.1 hypothetical protein (macronuclear) [Paramecium tetraurelia strain d4-2]